MSLKEKVSVTCAGLDSESLYFRQQEEERVRALREAAQKAADEAYREEHQYHCFRCGTKTLAEVSHRDVKIDICVGCGAVHLDAGELDALTKEDAGTLKKVHLAIFNVFK